ncbi:MAG: ATP-binding protein [Burkholderiaceae bacterium]|jgi:light-regulated signal transduction histidine kinase (bacteriophytochrome)
MASTETKLEAKVLERTVELAQRTAELEERSRQLESFSYSVSHDLRAPLRAISGFAQILSQRHRTGLDAEGKHFLDNIVEASSHMGRLIEDLLSYSRLGRTAFTLKPIDLSEVLGIVLLNLESRALEQGVRLEVAEDLPRVMGDSTLLFQIFANLLDNAITYRRPHVPSVVTLSWKREGDNVVLSVSDNGIGIDAAQFEKIFEVFQRLHTQERYPGTGIGLAVVTRAAQLQHGAVRVESTLGTGSTFHVTLQRAAAPASTSSVRVPGTSVGEVI